VPICRASATGSSFARRPRRLLALAGLALAASVDLHARLAAQQPVGGGSAPADGSGASIHITSPLGRTGLATTIRIVAQIDVPAGVTLSPVEFFVDGELIGTVRNGPPYAVGWGDKNPLEPREIVVQASDSAGHILRDVVHLPAYELTEKTDVTGILLETAVYDKMNHWASDLPPTAFTVREDGVPQKVDLVNREPAPTDLVLLVDNSQSLYRRMEFVRSACERLVRTLRERDRVIVAPFNAHVGTITGPTNDATTVAQAIGAMRAGGGTALLDALLEGNRLLQTGTDTRKVIVLITDGYDENSRADLPTVQSAIAASGATVYVVGVGGVAGISLRGERLLRTLADSTGGRVFTPPRENELVGAAESIAKDVHSRYLISYTPSNQKLDGLWRTITVEVPEGYRARTRPGYFAPAPPPIRPTFEFTVRDAARSYVDLTIDQVEVFEDEVPQKIDTFQEAVDPVSMVLVLDSSGSMKPSVDLVKQTAKDFIRAVRPEDTLALITFADQPKYAHVLTLNRDWSLEAIDKYTPLGGTALYDALWNAFQTLKPEKGRKAVVVLTDGRDENNPGTAPGSTHVFGDVVKLGKTVGATIFAVGLGEKVDRAVLEKLAEETGGQTYFASDASALATQFRKVVEDLRRRYVVSYTSTNATHDGGWRTVEIRPHMADFVVSAPGGYFAPED